MNEKFILNVFEKFEKSSAVLLHIKEGEAELTLKKEAAYQSIPAMQPFALQNAPIQPVAGADAAGYAATGTGVLPGAPVNGAAVSGAGMTAAGMNAAVPAGAASIANTAAGMPVAGAAPAGTVPVAASGAADPRLVTVKSPIVGSFYRSPSPDAPAYVDKGSKVSKGQPLCILEAMKMMNTLECEYDGTVEEILAANGDLVEFDQPLFIIRI
nr:acetyl-CoA carboxylase biotin carboxyl carrier protein [uncultured Treponema sp.]